MNKEMPILKPSGYRQEMPLFFKESLSDHPSSPVVAYGIDKGSHIEYEGASSENDFAERFPIFRKTALENLAQIQVKIEIQEVEGSKIAFITGHEYAAEKILDVDFMKSIGEKLGDQSLMVGIPFKGHMLANSSSSSIRGKVPGVIKKYYDNPQQDVISPYVFLVENGIVIGMGGESLPDAEDSKFGISEDMNTNNFTVEVTCESIEELKEIVNTTYQRILLTVMKNGSFGGDIHYKLQPTLPLSKELYERCSSFVDQIKSNEMAQTLVGAMTKSGINPRFSYDGKQIAPTHKDVIEDAKAVSEGESFSDGQTASKEEEQNLSNWSIDQLDQEYAFLTSDPSKRTDVPTLKKMVILMDEYEKRGVLMPSDRPAHGNQNPIRQGESSVDESAKPWWKFW